VSDGLCQCGCGQPAPIAPVSRRKEGWVKGQPLQFVHGHRGRRSGPRYLPADRGYETACWVWQWRIGPDGYGVVHVRRSPRQAHRVIYESHVGPIPAGLDLDHLCRVRACVNPAHLEPVTRAENIRRGTATKLTIDDVIEIRASSLSQRSLARSFHVSPAAIQSIKEGRTWRGVGI
jgi:hypothetical protein